MNKKLYRSKNDKTISGVCAGMGDYFDIDTTIIRLIAVVLLLTGHGITLIAYIVCAIVIPESPYDYDSPSAYVYNDNASDKPNEFSGK